MFWRQKHPMLNCHFCHSPTRLDQLRGRRGTPYTMFGVPGYGFVCECHAPAETLPLRVLWQLCQTNPVGFVVCPQCRGAVDAQDWDAIIRRDAALSQAPISDADKLRTSAQMIGIYRQHADWSSAGRWHPIGEDQVEKNYLFYG
jgi:hypothetical protein